MTWISTRLVQGLVHLLVVSVMARSQCPWPREVTELNGSCLCAYNVENELSIQCSSVNFTLLMTVLHQRSDSVPLDLLYVNNTRISVLNDRTFDGLVIENIQFSSCGIYNISNGAFRGLEDTLKNLNLQDNRITNIPSAALTRLRKLKLLDLSGNKITTVPDDAFKGSSLSTLKLADNELSLSEGSFSGLQRSLKNLNLKGTKLRNIPTAIRSLPVLAFLDVAQNQIRDLEPGSLRNLHSLTALNMERNLLQKLEPLDFVGVNDTLTSLSLLNNLITDFPKGALNTLTELRVLDIGFNLITEIPVDGFRGVKSLTLLALDGNPLPSIPGSAFTHLNSSLRGLSVGGRFLQCDCKVAWITEWIRDYDLQVTSRERNPQFCGQPPEYRERSFYQLGPDEFHCNITNNSDQPINQRHPHPQASSPRTTTPQLFQPTTARPTTTTSGTTTRSTTTTAPTTTTTTPKPTTPEPKVTTLRPIRLGRPGTGASNRAGGIGSNNGVGSVGSIQRGPGGESLGGRPTLDLPPQVPPTRNHRPKVERPLTQPVPSRGIRPNSKQRANDEAEAEDQFFGATAQGPFVEEVIVQDAYRKDNSVIIQWDSEVSNILGFRVVYRLFGDKNFKLGPPLAASEREFKIKNVPTQECIVVCVVSLEDVSVTPDNVEYSQCREIRTETSAAMHMDTIIIAASAAICGTVIIAVIVFICCNRRRGSSHKEKSGIPAVLSPISPPLASLGTLGSGTLGGNHSKADWDTISMYSQRSIPRARMYHVDKGSVNNGYIPDDARSHVSHTSAKLPRARSMADGQSQRSYSALSSAQLRHASSFSAGLGLSRPGSSASFGDPMGSSVLPPPLPSSFSSSSATYGDPMGNSGLPPLLPPLHSSSSAFADPMVSSGIPPPPLPLHTNLSMSRQSLAASQLSNNGFGTGMAVNPNAYRMGGAPGSTMGGSFSRGPSQRSDRRRQRSKSRERAGSRLSHAGSSHSLTGYDTDGWTDHDMDIYVARNPTRGGLVQL